MWGHVGASVLAFPSALSRGECEREKAAARPVGIRGRWSALLRTTATRCSPSVPTKHDIRQALLVSFSSTAQLPLRGVFSALTPCCDYLHVPRLGFECEEDGVRNQGAYRSGSPLQHPFEAALEIISTCMCVDGMKEWTDPPPSNHTQRTHGKYTSQPLNDRIRIMGIAKSNEPHRHTSWSKSRSTASRIRPTAQRAPGSVAVVKSALVTTASCLPSSNMLAVVQVILVPSMLTTTLAQPTPPTVAVAPGRKFVPRMVTGEAVRRGTLGGWNDSIVGEGPVARRNCGFGVR